MAKPNTPVPLESHLHYWLRVLRPVTWWLLLVLVLYGIRTHQRMMARTRLNFTVTLAGQLAYQEATTTFDGQPISSGQNIPLGHHQFTVTHPRGDSYTTNLFIWYGAHDFGTIDLNRSMAVLAVTADPPAPLLSIHGPEFDVELKNSPGMTSSVPTDHYVIVSKYSHWSQSDDVSMSAGRPTTWRIAPRLGAAQISCNEADATGQFMQADGQFIEAFTFPYAISELPEGAYKVTAQHHSDTRSQIVNITAGTTSKLSLEFLYGEALLETEPPGAAVRTSDGRYLGVTPLKMTELPPGSWAFSLQHDGYEAATEALTISAGQSTSFHTNLISLSNPADVTTPQPVPQPVFNAGSAPVIINTANDALNMADVKTIRTAPVAENHPRQKNLANDTTPAKPDNSEAMTSQRNAAGFASLQRARQSGMQGDYSGGIRELRTTLEMLPDNAEAKTLLTEYRQRGAEQREKQRLERPQRSNEVLKNTPSPDVKSTNSPAKKSKKRPND
jgi:hypothetical protein